MANAKAIKVTRVVTYTAYYDSNMSEESQEFFNLTPENMYAKEVLSAELIPGSVTEVTSISTKIEKDVTLPYDENDLVSRGEIEDANDMIATIAGLTGIPFVQI